jgi:hypothetical protein
MNKSAQDVCSPLLTEQQAASYLTRSVSSLRRDRKNGVGPRFVRAGRSIRYPKVELDVYLSALINPGVRGGAQCLDAAPTFTDAVKFTTSFGEMSRAGAGRSRCGHRISRLPNNGIDCGPRKSGMGGHPMI